MEVTVAELRTFADRLLSHLEQSGNAVVSIPHNFYWEIMAPECYDMTTVPEKPTVGELSFDLQNLQGIIARDECIGYGLVWLGALLRAIGSEVVR